MYPKSIILILLTRLLFFFFFIFCISTSAQDANKLKDLRESLLKEIEASNSLLIKAKEEQGVSLKKVQLLNSQISKRKAVINIYKEQIKSIEINIRSADSTINIIQRNIDKIKKEYALLLNEAFKRRNSYSNAVYFLSAESFNQAYQRYRMIQELNQYRKSQVIVLTNTSKVLQDKRQQLALMKSEVVSLLSDITVQNSTLESEKIIQQTNILKLQKKESILKSELKDKQKKEKELENQIFALIAAESKKKDYKVSQFDKAKGKLRWPISKGVVVSEFGEHAHPVLKGVVIKNNGIDIQISSSREVLSVFDGEVSRVVGIPGYNKAVIVRHGKFLTVYANLGKVNVTAGSKILEGSKIGEVHSSDNEDSDVLHFEIWEESVKINPSIWLKR